MRESPEKGLEWVSAINVHSFSIGNSLYDWHWISQPPGKGLRWLSVEVNNGGKRYANSVKSRITIFADQSRNEFSLQVNSLIASNSSVYFCARETHCDSIDLVSVKKEEIVFMKCNTKQMEREGRREREWVFSDIQLVESGPGMVRPGSFSIATSSAAWHWVRQSPGKGLEWISAIHPSSRGKWYGNSVKGHATISADQTRNEFSLQLNSVTAADSSVYFCAQDYTMRQDLFGLCKKMEFVFTKCNAK
ncbi:hypothetical protein E2320_006417 [Naja naja]|nr:hypothetical protein E2320_006417 [Naja naja]